MDTGDDIAHVEGLPSVMSQELLEFPGGVLGVALNLEEHTIGAVILGDYERIEGGRRGSSAPAKSSRFGSATGSWAGWCDPLGQPIDGRGEIESEDRRVLELRAPSVIHRQAVNQPLQTGIKATDSRLRSAVGSAS